MLETLTRVKSLNLKKKTKYLLSLKLNQPNPWGVVDPELQSVLRSLAPGIKNKNSFHLSTRNLPLSVKL